MNIIEYLKDEQTKKQIISLILSNLDLYQGINSKQKIDSFTGILHNMFVKECVQNNQYISLSNSSISKLITQYGKLINQLREVKYNNFYEIKNIVESHRYELIKIIEYNCYSETTNQKIIPCYEYTDDFQFSILRLGEFNLIEPIMDVGCGENCSLVNLLIDLGYKRVFGIDQYVSNEKNILTGNWFDYFFKKNSFGTIISHMALSNHFKRSIIDNDHNKQKIYENKYFEILEALKPDGLFIYTPSLSSIEEKVDREYFSIKRYENAADKELDTVIIKKV